MGPYVYHVYLFTGIRTDTPGCGPAHLWPSLTGSPRPVVPVGTVWRPYRNTARLQGQEHDTKGTHADI